VAVRYSTIERIAVGGMGEVFLARQEGLGGFRRTVVLKRLLPNVEEDDGHVKRFLDEAHVAAVLAHDNVVSVLEVGEEEGQPFLALEYVHGENAGALRTRAKRKGLQFPVVVVARIVADAARGLAHAHETKDVEGKPLHIVHRDVAPKNIFVRADGVSKIGDFGIAKSEARLSKTEAGSVPGTLAYMSPEQARGEDVGPASDQFSLGIVLWELLAGERLFKAESPQETLRALLSKKVRRPSNYRHDAEVLDAIALRMLERDPARRFPSLAEAAMAIEEAMPDTRAELGQRAVAAFVDVVAGEELAERQKRIEAGPDPSRVAGEATVPLAQSPSHPSNSDDVTVEAKRLDSEVATTDGRPRARPVVMSGAATSSSPETGVVPGASGSIATSSPRARSRAPLVAAVAAVAVVIAAVAAFVVVKRDLTPQERTIAYLEQAQKKNPLMHHAVMMTMAAQAGVDEEKAKAVSDALVKLLEERLAMSLAYARKSDAEREATQKAHLDDERRLEDAARRALANVGDEDFRVDALDMWDYDAGAPVKWLPPDDLADVQRDLQSGTLEYLTSQAELRKQASDRMLARTNVDVAALRKRIDPLIAERDSLIEELAHGPASELASLARRIAGLKAEGTKILVAACGSPMGEAVADVAFALVSEPGVWQPVFANPPSVREEKAQGQGFDLQQQLRVQDLGGQEMAGRVRVCGRGGRCMGSLAPVRGLGGSQETQFAGTPQTPDVG
jgi:serine/threonine-protein kinase